MFYGFCIFFFIGFSCYVVSFFFEVFWGLCNCNLIINDFKCVEVVFFVIDVGDFFW